MTSPRSRYFTLTALCHSDTALAEGLDNTPSDDLLPNLMRLAQGLDAVQDLLHAPLLISSGYRSPALNARVGGVPTSQHTMGLAADFTAPEFGEPLEIAAAIARSAIGFDQLILEFGRWVHISFADTPRGRTLTIYTRAEGYLEGIRARDGRWIA